MNDYKPANIESTELDDRDVRALTEYMTVLDEGGDTYSVTTESGSEYRVDAREGRCTCPDDEHRDARCKHRRRVAFATGEESIPAWADIDAVDPQLGEHVDGGPQLAATDGGVILEDETADPWSGPFDEYDKYGEPTGSSYVRCRDCGIEVVTSIDADTVGHRDGCRFEESDDGTGDGRPEPTRSEPADFGGGESTGVQEL